jgi:hypothetical protein
VFGPQGVGIAYRDFRSSGRRISTATGIGDLLLLMF